MTKDRENEIRQMSRERQEALLNQLVHKYGGEFLAPGQAPTLHDARELAAADEERELLEELLKDSE